MREFVTKDFVQSVMEQASVKFGTTVNNKNLILLNIDVENIYSTINRFDKPEIFTEAYEGLSSEINSASEFIKYTTDYIVVQIGIAIIEAAKNLRIVTEKMTFDEQINYLIDLKTSDNSESNFVILSSMLEKIIINQNQFNK